MRSPPRALTCGCNQASLRRRSLTPSAEGHGKLALHQALHRTPQLAVPSGFKLPAAERRCQLPLYQTLPCIPQLGKLLHLQSAIHRPQAPVELVFRCWQIVLQRLCSQKHGNSSLILSLARATVPQMWLLQRMQSENMEPTCCLRPVKVSTRSCCWRRAAKCCTTCCCQDSLDARSRQWQKAPASWRARQRPRDSATYRQVHHTVSTHNSSQRMFQWSSDSNMQVLVHCKVLGAHRTSCRVSAAARREHSQAEKAARCCGRTHAASAAASPVWRSRASAAAPCVRNVVHCFAECTSFGL
jgi:hypothetical protein